jgi:biotin carboxyl carrier protein
MSKKMKVHVNGNLYEVEIDDLNQSPMNVTVNGEGYLVVLETGSGLSEQAVISAPTITASTQAPVSITPKAAPVVSSSSSSEIRSPMPGLIVNIVARPGLKVTRGQPLLSLEAMKMKNAIRSPRDGVIQSIAVSEGQKVAYNDLLVTFE